MTKRDELIHYCKIKGVVSTHEIMQFGLDNYDLRADRTKRDLVKEGLLRKLPDEEKILRGFNCKDAVYEWTGREKQIEMAI